MNVKFLSMIPWLSLLLLWLAYALLGWYLSAHHIVWLVGAFVATVALAVVWKSSPWLERLVKFGSQGSIVVLFISLIGSISVALVATNAAILLTLIFMPWATTFLAKLEMHSAGLSQRYTFLFLTIIAGLGLALGEIIDFVFLPSIRY